MGLGWLAAAAVLAQADPVSVVAAEAGSGVIAYPAAFFADARPNDAYEMLQRLPGFTFDGGAPAVRGIAGSSGNVLIDGQRPSTKSVDLASALRRIPAANVVRIELIRGAAPGIDMQGRALVANVVRSSSASSSVIATVGAYYGYFDDGRVHPRLDLEASRQAGDLSLDGAIRAYLDPDDDGGDGFRTRRTRSGATVETGAYRARIRDRWLQANGSAVLDRGRDTFRANLGGELHRDNSFETVRRSDGAGRPLGAQSTVIAIDERQGEAGADVERIFNPRVTGRLVGLATRSRRTEDEASAAPGAFAASANIQKAAETVLRGVLTVRRSPALSFEFGGEGALNVLDSTNRLVVDGAPVSIPNANVRVEEKRADGFVTAFWTPRPQLSVELSARAEASRIAQSGDTRSARSFFFPKPRLLATYSPSADTQLRLRAERLVGQLDFADFAASTELESSTVSAGGADLEPERSWLLEAAFERRFWGEGAVVLTVSHAEVQQVVDRIPLPGGFDAPGNIGDGVRQQAVLNATLPLDRLGLRGGLLTGTATWRRSRVTDPVTGERRRISEEATFQADVHFSHDIARLRSTWGVDAVFLSARTIFRIDEVRRESEGVLWTLYWDWKPRPELSVRAEVRNLGRMDKERVRTLYQGPRSLGVVRTVEHRVHGIDPLLYLRVRRAL